ncbi:MAG TPA: hypothetical protein VHG33_09245, partial [Woeseiaceae bacterium]|nr:hypothetical protein [Woeseiaceae bacterium]
MEARRFARRWAACATLLLMGCAAGAAEADTYGRYLTNERFLQLAFGPNPPQPEMLRRHPQHLRLGQIRAEGELQEPLVGEVAPVGVCLGSA